MSDPDQHARLIELGLELHEACDYHSALPFFLQAIEETPHCVAAQYNYANTLHMLDRDYEAAAVLMTLLQTNDEVFRAGCPFEEDPAPFKLDALFLLFLSSLGATQSWQSAYPYAEQHLKARCGDIESVFTDEFVHEEIESLRSKYNG